MPRPRKPPRLYLRHRSGRAAQWVILDGSQEVSTGAGADELTRASKAFESYLIDRHQPPRGAVEEGKLLVDEVMTIYLREHAINSPSRDWIANMSAPILEWWAGKALQDINGPNCRAYVKWRTSQNVKAKTVRLVSDQTARHELKTLRAAINFYHAEKKALRTVPVVTTPARSPPRDNYFLTRTEAARRIKAARKNPKSRHVARLILIGIYTGTRPGAILMLGWFPSPTGGWFDLDAGVLHRRGEGARRTRKRQPPVKIHRRLLPHLRRWRTADLARRVPHVVHFQGALVKKLRRSWATVRKAAGHKRNDTPHIVRHTAATWQMQWGTDLFEAAGYLGMSVQTLLNEYGHHHPDFQSNAAQASPKKRMNQGRTK